MLSAASRRGADVSCSTNSPTTLPRPSPGSDLCTSSSSLELRFSAAWASIAGSQSCRHPIALRLSDAPTFSFQYQLAVGSAFWIFGMFMLSLSKTFVQLFLSQSVCLGVRPAPLHPRGRQY